MGDRKLVILTTHFGLNFSGGSNATCEIFQRLESDFSKVIIVCNEVGTHCFKNPEIRIYKNNWQLWKILSSMEKNGTVFYGDFYNSYWYVLLGIPFFFTYHDNWPELARSSFKNRIKSLFYTPIYKLIFKNAAQVVSVSQFRTHYIRKYNTNVSLIRNGFNSRHKANRLKTKDILMVGNIDYRKYALALKLFSLLKNFDLTINIYGNIKDQKIAQRLKRFPFVKIHGFVENVPYRHYQLLLHTSLVENLSLVFCEALSHGIPILTFGVGGAGEVIDDGDNGILIPPYDIHTMNNSLTEIISGKTKFDGLPKALEEFSWDVASEKYKNLMYS